MSGSDYATPRDLDGFLKEHPAIHAIDAVFPDICGILRGKRLTLELARQLFSDGLQMPGSMLLLSVSGGSLDPLGKGVSDGDPDVLIRPLAGSLHIIPWAGEARAQVTVGFVNDDGKPSTFEPRALLSRVLARFDQLGLTPVIAGEVEFCLIDPECGADGRPQRPRSPKSGLRHNSNQLMSLSYVDDFGTYIEDVRLACEALAVPITAINAEYGGDQFEINLHHIDNAMTAADHTILLKQIVQSVAINHDIRASFMAKPYADTAGSGMHWHMSLLDESGCNVFDDDGGDDGSEILRHAIAGVLQTMPECMAYYAPNINSFRRFQPGLFVPVSRSWGYNNRSVAVRIPGGSPANRRLEFRVPGADANPYLALAALLAGAHHGIAAKLEPPPPSTGNACEAHDAGLPLRLDDALRCCEKAGTLADYLGADYCAVYADCKRLEFDEFLQEMSAREANWYLRPDA